MYVEIDTYFKVLQTQTQNYSYSLEFYLQDYASQDAAPSAQMEAGAEWRSFNLMLTDLVWAVEAITILP